MKRRMFLKNLAAGIAIPWARVLAPAVCEPVMPEVGSGWQAVGAFAGLYRAEMEGAREDLILEMNRQYFGAAGSEISDA